MLNMLWKELIEGEECWVLDYRDKLWYFQTSTLKLIGIIEKESLKQPIDFSDDPDLEELLKLKTWITNEYNTKSK